MYWMDFYNGISCGVFFCGRLIAVSPFRLPRRGLPRPTCISFPATTLRATTLHRYHTGYHAQGYHAIVRFYSWVATPELSRSTTHVNRVITLDIVVPSLPIISYHPTCSSPSTPPPGRHTYQPIPHASDSIERVGRALLSANEEN